MDESRKIVLKETAALAVGLAICVAVMYGIYGLLGFWSIQVLLGGLAGLLLAVGNFFFMAVIATLAADRAENQDVDGGKKLLRSSYPIRLLVQGAAIALCAVSGWFDLLATALPLLFVRPVLTAAEFFRKKGA